VRFIDTNVLLYTISRDPAEQAKAKRANDILTDRDLALSVQVLQEFYLQATRASRPDAIAHQQAVRLIESFRRFDGSGDQPGQPGVKMGPREDVAPATPTTRPATDTIPSLAPSTPARSQFSRPAVPPPCGSPGWVARPCAAAWT
jgi:hypothetical protein